ncbi:MAG: branched-chain amino acid transport system ATP-binding protein [Rhodospirillaceae bacterium]|jgi:branched-chain amino acid transport system ATP-binding protein|nr:branched-chain amino acid transport system ATP-binding protein [Rhodospirillaceae bacterium]
MALLAIRGLDVRYGPIEAVRGAVVEVERGEIVALLGANGAGKSSLLNACMGLVPSTAGSVLLDGQELRGERTEAIVRRGITLTPEGRRIFPGLTVQENLDIGAAASPALRRRAAETREEMFALFPRLLERREQQAGTLSGGEQQMLAIARSLMSRPSVLLLDEPSLGLAPNIVDQIFDLIAELRRRGITLLLVEQNVELSLDIADRGYVLAGGRIVLHGTPQELRVSGELEGAYLGRA